MFSLDDGMQLNCSNKNMMQNLTQCMLSEDPFARLILNLGF